MLNKIKAFTLAEVMVTLTVMGVLASIMIPVVRDASPDKQKAAFKKAYYVAERIVYDMVTDDDLYPEMGTYIGFDNTQQVEYNGLYYSGDTKFVQLFAAHVNKSSTSRPNGISQFPEEGDVGDVSIITSDGIYWYIPASDFVDCNGLPDGTEDPAHALKIMVDVNGSRDPNKDGIDRFYMYIQTDGRMFVTGTQEKSYIQSSSLLK